MCDYSLEQKLSRPAKVGDKLVTKRFSSFTTGFTDASIPDCDLAICMLPGTEIAFDDEVKLAAIDTEERLPREAVFVAMGNPEIIHEHHDGLEFPSVSKQRLINSIAPDQKATVLQVPAEKIPAPEAVVAAPELVD
jgi:hypothetical protein